MIDFITPENDYICHYAFMLISFLNAYITKGLHRNRDWHTDRGIPSPCITVTMQRHHPYIYKYTTILISPRDTE